MARIDGVRDKLAMVSNFRIRRSSKSTAKKSAQGSVAILEKPKDSKVAAPTQVPSSFKEVTPLIEPYAHAAITHDPATGGMLYFVIEPTLLDEDKDLLSKLRDILIEELDVDVRKILTKDEAQKLLRSKVDGIIKEYKIKVEAEVLDKLMYFLTRDFILHGKIEPFMRDHMIEDISCDGPNVPIYIWHRQYESMPTNVIFMFILPDDKTVTIEDTPELNIPHKNWISAIARVGFGAAGSTAEITLFDLLKAAMRQRPDYIIVGEVRGEEAFTLFQAMATGHGGLSSLHADSVMAAIRRLETAPLNIPRTLLPTLNVICYQARLKIGDLPARRLVHLAEALGIDASSGELDLNDVFRWNPRTDSFTYSGRSHTIERLAERAGVSLDIVQEEKRHRKTVLDWMA